MFFILANTIESVDTVTHLLFSIDSEPAGQFDFDPQPTDPSDVFIYNATVYVNESIPFGSHRLRMEATNNRSVLMLFDYLIET